MQVNRFSQWFNSIVEQAVSCNERRLVLLSGDETWAVSLLKSIDKIAEVITKTEGNFKKGELASSNCVIYGDCELLPNTVLKNRYRDLLGSEASIVIFADSDFTVDAFAALSGTLLAGGILILVMPQMKKQTHDSFFMKRLFNILNANPRHYFICQSKSELPPYDFNTFEQIADKKQESYAFECMTAEQLAAVKAIIKVVTGHRKRPLILTADRGRGKSSALAIACAELMKSTKENNFRILITAPDKQALTVFFSQLTKCLPGADIEQNNIYFGNSLLTFIAIDQLIKQPVKANLLLVDEAAAIPVYLLKQLLMKNHRMVFSSTVHGYEGAGRGFTLKFQKILSQICPQWQNLHIKQPIRWREHDPLEKLVFDVCLLNTELPVLSNSQQTTFLADAGPTTNDQLLFKIIDAKTLVSNEPLLQELFAILITAHYQTKPSDLQLLLDNPQVQLACLFSNSKKETLIAVALLMNEGANNSVDEAAIIAIKLSKQRLRNHFLPQSLLSHCGVEKAFDYSYLRIMRIAVHPELHTQGIGSYFIRQIEIFAENQGIDFMGSSFGANSQLLSFWLKAGYATARIGFTKDKASGEHSALMIKGLSSESYLLQKKLGVEFYRSFDYLLIEEYEDLSTEMVHLLLSHQQKDNLTTLTPQDLANVYAFSTGERLYSSCAYSLYLWLKHDLLSSDRKCYKDSHQKVAVVIARLIQKYSCSKVCQQYGLTGKKMLNQQIKNYILSRTT
jgi:tRNA(Met) cytidine acetyltransferase